MTAHDSTDHERAAALLGMYAMGIADPDETRDVERHVARCADCHAELQSLLATTDELAVAPDQQPMPARLRSSILDAVDTASDAPTPLHAHRARRTRRTPRIRWSIVAPLAACSVLALGLAAAQTSRLNEANDDIAALNRRLDPARGTESMIGTSRAVSLETSGMLERATVELVDVHGAGLLVTKDLPAPPDGFEWRVWGVTTDHDMHPMGSLAPRAEHGMGLQPIAGLDSPDLDGIAITLERSDDTTQRGPMVGYAQMV